MVVSVGCGRASRGLMAILFHPVGGPERRRSLRGPAQCRAAGVRFFAPRGAPALLARGKTWPPALEARRRMARVALRQACRRARPGGVTGRPASAVAAPSLRSTASFQRQEEVGVFRSKLSPETGDQLARVQQQIVVEIIAVRAEHKGQDSASLRASAQSLNAAPAGVIRVGGNVEAQATGRRVEGCKVMGCQGRDHWHLWHDVHE